MATITHCVDAKQSRDDRLLAIRVLAAGMYAITVESHRKFRKMLKQKNVQRLLDKGVLEFTEHDSN